MLNIDIEPSDQGVAARLGLAAVDLDAGRVDAALDALAAAGLDRALAVVAVLTRNLAAEMASHYGVEIARAILARTVLDAQAADDA